MRIFIVSLIISAASVTLGTCGSPAQRSATSTQPGSASSSPATQPPTVTGDGPPIAVAHGGNPSVATQNPGQQGTGQSGADTKALDERISRAEIKAKAKGASESDKQAAAEAYLERANVYYSAGQPKLYKFALGDFRHVLRYDPQNAEAREKLDMLVSIYQQMGRPVPDNGNEP